MAASKAAALLDHAARVPAAFERSVAQISPEVMGHALMQADAVTDELVRAAHVVNPAPVGLIHRVLNFQNVAVGLFAQRKPGSVQQIRQRFTKLVKEVDDGLVLIQQAERRAVAEAHAAALQERDGQLAALHLEVEILGHASTSALEEGIADQRALRAAQQQLVQAQAAHERDLVAQETRLGETNRRAAQDLAQQQQELSRERRALLDRERTWNQMRRQLEADKKAAQDLVGSLNAELIQKDAALTAALAELETLRAARPLEVVTMPDSPTAPLSVEQPTTADALSLRAFLVERGVQASFEERTNVKTVTADAPITPALLAAWAEAYPDAQARRAHVAAAMRKVRAA